MDVALVLEQKGKVNHYEPGELDSLFDSLINMLQTQFDIWAIKGMGKTTTRIIQCKTCLEMMRTFMRKDNYKACVLTLQKCPNFVKKLKKCFYKKPKKEVNSAVRLYRKICKRLSDWVVRLDCKIVKK
jgi:hypothetical protein